MNQEFEERKRQVGVQEMSPFDRLRGVQGAAVVVSPEFVYAPPDLEAIIVAEGTRNKLRPIETVEFTTGEGKRVHFQTVSQEGKSLAGLVVDRILSDYGSGTNWENLISQAESISSGFRPVARELRSYFEVASIVFSENQSPSSPAEAESLEKAAFLEKIGLYFESQEERFTRRSGRLKLNAEGKRFADAAYNWFQSLFPSIASDEFKELLGTGLEDSPQTRLLRQSLLGKCRWEDNQRLYVALKKESPVEVITSKSEEDPQATLFGAANFQRELSLAIKQIEQELGRGVETLPAVREIGRVSQADKERLFLMLEQQHPAELSAPAYDKGAQIVLSGEARFEQEFQRAIQRKEEESGREIDVAAEIKAFEAELRAETEILETEVEQQIERVAIAQEEPKNFREKVRAGWSRFTNWFVKEKGYKKVALAAVSAVSLGVVLATCAGIPQRLFSQEPLLPDRPQSNPRSTGEPKPDLSRVTVSVPQWQPLAREAIPQASLIQPSEPRPELRAAQDEAEKQRFLAMVKDFSAKNQSQSEAGQLAQVIQPEPEKAEGARTQEVTLSVMDRSASRVIFEADREKEKDESRREGPPPPMNPTPEPTKAQEEIRAQTEPTLIIGGIPHNADLNPDTGVFEAQGTWVGLDEDGQLPDPPKDKVALHDVGFLYGQTPDGKAELVASEGDIHAYIHNAQRWAEAGWPRWKDWLSLAFDQGGIKVGDIIEFGGAKYKVVDIGQVDPSAMLAELFVPTKEFMGRRLVISTCSTPPEGVFTSSTDLGLPRQVVTAVLVESGLA